MTNVIRFKNNVYLDGTIIEKGSNSNGYYIKYSDGTMVQYGLKSLGDINFNTAAGNMYRGANNENIAVVEYPVSFNDKNNGVVVTVEGNNYLSVSCNNTRGSKTQFTVYVLSPQNGSVRSIAIPWIAIGRWK